MLERYYVRPETIDRIRSSWIGEAVDRYVAWLTKEGYSSRSVLRRVPILVRFGKSARSHGITEWRELPGHVEPFVETWVAQRAKPKASALQRKKIAEYVRNPIRQMIRLILPGYVGLERFRKPANPFERCAPRFFDYLRDEKGLRESSIDSYRHSLHQFAAYLRQIGLEDIDHLSPTVLSGFVADYGQRVGWSSLRNACGVLRVFLRYLYRERVLTADVSRAVEAPQSFRLSGIPRAIGWDDVERVLETVDRRTPTGRRDYAILLLLATYGLRAREVAALTLDDIDWRNDRLRIPERKAGHSTAYPLSSVVGEAILDYLRNGRPRTQDRHVFFRAVAPISPIGHAAVSSRAGYYLRRAGVQVPRPGSHTFRHTCVQRLVDKGFSLKTIGDFVGHRATASTQIYSKVAVEALRQLALGDGEEAL